MRWSSYLTKVLSSTVGAAAGGFVAVHSGSPVVGQAAETAARTSIEELLTEFLPAQQDALEQLTEITRDVREIVSGIRADVEVLLDTPWQAALLHVEYAAQHSAQAATELDIARQKLFEAYAGARTHAKRAFIAQQLCAVYALMGQDQDSKSWLFRSYPEEAAAVNESVEEVAKALSDVPYERRMKLRPTGPFGGPRPGYIEIRPGALFGEKPDPRGAGVVRQERVEPALMSLARLTMEMLVLRGTCAKAGMPEPWPSVPGADAKYLWPSGGSLELRVNSARYLFTAPRDNFGRPWYAVGIYRNARQVRFRSLGTGSHANLSNPLYVFGSTPELGNWDVRRAIPLHVNSVNSRKWAWTPPPKELDHGSWWSAELRWTVEDTGPSAIEPEAIEYQYLTGAGEHAQFPLTLESGPNRTLTVANAGEPGVYVEDVWHP